MKPLPDQKGRSTKTELRHRKLCHSEIYMKTTTLLIVGALVAHVAEAVDEFPIVGARDYKGATVPAELAAHDKFHHLTFY